MEFVESKLREICDRFQVPGYFAGYEHIKVGNVNQTYTVVFREAHGRRRQYLLQRINTYAFRKPERLMKNVALITEHIRAKDSNKTSIQYQYTAEGVPYYIERDEFWRMYNFIPAVTYCSAENEKIVRGTGIAFGTFQSNLSDFDPTMLYETIPDFHNTPKRIMNLKKSVERDLVGRVEEVQDELNEILALAEKAYILRQMYEEGKLPLRVTHNDTKLNNVLFDEKTNEAITVIDLDTVMPGLMAYDFGDAIRFMANYVAEDSPEWEKAGCDMNIFRTFTEGFLQPLKGHITQEELDTMCYGPFVLSLELASRFLDDYLLGDQYFKTDYEDHNLVRTRCQLAMAKDCLAKIEEMNRIIHEYAD